MEQARIEHAPNGSLLTYITSADALVNKHTSGSICNKNRSINKKNVFASIIITFIKKSATVLCKCPIIKVENSIPLKRVNMHGTLTLDIETYLLVL